MTYFNPKTEDDRVYAKWIRRLKLANNVLNSTPLEDVDLWKERLGEYGMLYRSFLTAYPSGAPFTERSFTEYLECAFRHGKDSKRAASEGPLL